LIAGQLPPLTVKDICLMLRSGCSSEMILRDCSARHFAGPLDLAGENEVRRANASPALLDALSNNAASEEELAQAHKRIADTKGAAQRAAEQEAADHTQSGGDQKRADAYREYLAQLGAAQKLDERVKVVISNSFIADSWFSPDQERVLNRAQQVVGQEFPNRRDGRRSLRIHDLMQDEAFVRDALK
jgi:hypothetical protein